uniref:Putative YopX protein n=1 Tax=viral metagenome TaxID=1070528 RepID=A0A6M3KF06_9ZZZZ
MNNDRLRYRAWKHKGIYSGQMFYLRGPDLDGVVWFGPEGGDLYYDVEDVLWGDEFTPLQCVGRKDTNDTLIYEGDIARDREGHLFKCEWNADFICFEFNGRYRNSYGDTNDWSVGGAGYPHLEIIGNIYESPDLLLGHGDLDY